MSAPAQHTPRTMSVETCPWCGSVAELRENDDCGSAPWLAAWVACTKRRGCEAEGPVVKLPKDQDARGLAIAKWNGVARAYADRDAERAAHAATLVALVALLGIVSTEDIYSGLSPREFVRTRVSGITLGSEADGALVLALAAIAQARARGVAS